MVEGAGETEGAGARPADDERVFRVLAKDALEAEGFRVHTVATMTQARQELTKTVDALLDWGTGA